MLKLSRLLLREVIPIKKQGCIASPFLAGSVFRENCKPDMDLALNENKKKVLL